MKSKVSTRASIQTESSENDWCLVEDWLIKMPDSISNTNLLERQSLWNSNNDKFGLLKDLEDSEGKYNVKLSYYSLNL